jgi:hypothetical protein
MATAESAAGTGEGGEVRRDIVGWGDELLVAGALAVVLTLAAKPSPARSAAVCVPWWQVVPDPLLAGGGGRARLGQCSGMTPSYPP